MAGQAAGQGGVVVFAPALQPAAACPLCASAGGPLLWADANWRVIRVEDADVPAFYRVIAREHVAEFTDLPPAQQLRCMALVAAVERVLREQLQPTKINLAAFGNMVPHLHWHVMARFEWDAFFPQPLWGPRQRELAVPAVQRLACGLADMDAAVASAVAAI